MACFRIVCIALPGLMFLLALPSPVHAKPRTVRDRAGGIATQPMRDLNMMPARVPAALEAVLAAPYESRQLETCAAIARAVAALDAVLPADVDDPAAASGQRGMGEALADAGGDLIVGLMPLRGVVRAVSGASIAEARRRWAINRGEARRSFLKGVGFARGCAPPAAPGPPAIIYEFGL